MKTVQLKVAAVGNSRGVRLPSATLKRYGIGDSVMMEERSDGILLRPPGVATTKLSWDETAEAMAHAAEAWGEWEIAAGDGLEDVPWDPAPSRHVAEVKREYGTKKRPRDR